MIEYHGKNDGYKEFDSFMWPIIIGSMIGPLMCFLQVINILVS